MTQVNWTRGCCRQMCEIIFHFQGLCLAAGHDDGGKAEAAHLITCQIVFMSDNGNIQAKLCNYILQLFKIFAGANCSREKNVVPYVAFKFLQLF